MSNLASDREIQLPLRVGIVGTGFAAKVRAQTLIAESRTHVVGVAGRNLARTAEFAEGLQIKAIDGWQQLMAMSEIDLVVVATINGDHGEIVRAAIESGKHVIVEYPLAIDYQQATEIVALAAAKKVMLHVEHIELLGGLHQTMREWWDRLGEVHYARYSTIVTQRPIPQKWTFDRTEFGFPLIAALSRLHRFTDLFGAVESVSCQNRYWGGAGNYYTTCLCTAQLRFKNSNAIGEVVYGKGEGLWENSRKFEVHGAAGALIFDGDEGAFITSETSTPLDAGARKGLFAKDLELVLAHLIDGAPIYVTPAASLATLRVADAARRSAETNRTISVESI